MLKVRAINVSLALSVLIFLISSVIPLGSDRYLEKGCVEDPASAINLKASWISKIAAWYVPMASAYFYNRWVEKLTNRSATPDKIQRLCLKLLFLAPKKPKTPYMVVAGGLNHSVGYQCTAIGPHHQECEGVAGSPGYEKGNDVVDLVVKTDNKHYALVVRCVKDKFRSWYAMTPNTTDLIEEVRKEVLQHVVNLGYERKFASMISYDKCPKVRPNKKVVPRRFAKGKKKAGK